LGVGLVYSPADMTKCLNLLAHPRMVFWLLPWLMVLLVAGTLAQRSIGLYEAERQYFASWLVWLGPLPLPGMYPTLAVLASALLAKTLFRSPWHPYKAGIYITHLGALLLMAGGLLTALHSEEGFVALQQGDTKQQVSDYHARELVVLKNGEGIARVPAEALQPGMHLQETPFTITLASYCRNCQPVPREATDLPVHGVAEKFDLKSTALETEDEANQSGAVLQVTGAGEADGLYVTFEPVPHPPGFSVGDDAYLLQMQREQRELPFSITLHSVEKLTHPGMDMAREYQSEVTITDSNGLQFQRLIRMNEPLRIEGYTLYQASLADARGELVSVLAVVKNKGRVFPYVAGVAMALGLLVHCVQRLRRHA